MHEVEPAMPGDLLLGEAEVLPRVAVGELQIELGRGAVDDRGQRIAHRPPRRLVVARVRLRGHGDASHHVIPRSREPRDTPRGESAGCPAFLGVSPAVGTLRRLDRFAG